MPMSGKRVVIVGAVALGPKAACRLKRLEPEAEVVMIDQDEYISYGGCGIPYFISGDISEVRELMSTSFHMQRTPQFFENAKDVHVRVRTRALEIDRQRKVVRVRDLGSGAEEDLSYDKLVLATGSRPNRPPVAGMDLPGVIAVSDLHSAVAVKEAISGGKVESAVIIGAGAIGCEMAEALSDLWGIETSVVEMEKQVMPGILDSSLARIVQTHLEEKGVRLCLGRRVGEIAKTAEGLRVVTGNENLDAELVIVAAGVRPNSDLAGSAGLLVAPSGAIIVNRRLQTSDPAIFAGGDCIEIPHLIT